VQLKTFIDIAGWAGAAFILGAFGLISSARIEARSPWYQWMNILGSVGLIINGSWHAAWPNVGLNVVWFLIAMFALRRNRRARTA
jgi:hypothetical protein